MMVLTMKSLTKLSVAALLLMASPAISKNTAVEDDLSIPALLAIHPMIVAPLSMHYQMDTEDLIDLSERGPDKSSLINPPKPVAHKHLITNGSLFSAHIFNLGLNLALDFASNVRRRTSNMTFVGF